MDDLANDSDFRSQQDDSIPENPSKWNLYSDTRINQLIAEEFRKLEQKAEIQKNKCKQQQIEKNLVSKLFSSNKR